MESSKSPPQEPTTILFAPTVQVPEVPPVCGVEFSFVATCGTKVASVIEILPPSELLIVIVVYEPLNEVKNVLQLVLKSEVGVAP